MSDRAAAIDRFLAAAGWGDATRRPLPGDASFRRYVRLDRGVARAMLMDAPPPREDVRPFLAVARLLHGMALSAPGVLAADVETGLLLLEDFGDDTYTRLLVAGADERELYALAVDVLIALDRRLGRDAAPALPPYDDDRLLAEAALLVDWYLPALTGAPTGPALREAYLALWRRLLPLARGVPETLVLRDYHVDNLMRLGGRGGVAACGLLDFQDAVIGPLSYDLVSLLEDARRDIPAEIVNMMRARFLAAFPAIDRADFDRSYAVLGAQRAAKIVGIFTRLHVRDGKPSYLAHIPRVRDILVRDARHPDLAPLALWLERHLPAALAGGMTAVPATAMVLAAGLGTRLRPITDRLPKPLVAVAGRTLIDRALDRLVAAGVRRAVVNLHYKGEMIASHLARRRDIEIAFSPEESLLDTGGGIAKALPLLDARFFVINSDILWRDGKDPALLRLAGAFDAGRHDALLLLQRTTSAIGYDGRGDFMLDQVGILRRRREHEVAPHLFAGIQLLHRRLFDRAPAGAFSNNELWDIAIAAGRCAGLVHDGEWFHVGTASGLAATEARLAPRRPGR